MFRGNTLHVAGKAAILAALLGGSAALAQEAAPVVQPTVAPPVQQAPVLTVTPPAAAPVVQPPAVVRTIPDEALNRPTVRAEQPAPRRRAATAAVAPRSAPRIAEPAQSAAPVVNQPSAVVDPLPQEIPAPDTAIVEDSTAIAPVAEPAVEQDSAIAPADWTLAGGIAAILAALGLGALAMRRRRRAVNDNHVEPVAVVPAAVAPVAAPVIPVAPRPMMAPIKDDPVFRYAAPTPAEDRLIQPAPVLTRPDVPVTDPLFSHKPVAAPITDPLFAPKREVESPITDPLFAKNDRYVGRGAVPAREPELIN